MKPLPREQEGMWAVPPFTVLPLGSGQGGRPGEGEAGSPTLADCFTPPTSLMFTVKLTFRALTSHVTYNGKEEKTVNAVRTQGQC